MNVQVYFHLVSPSLRAIPDEIGGSGNHHHRLDVVSEIATSLSLLAMTKEITPFLPL